MQAVLQDECQVATAKPEKVRVQVAQQIVQVNYAEHAYSPGRIFIQDRESAFSVVSRLYVQYVRILRNLEECYDQVVHPQKRILLRQLLDCTIGRILELKVLS